MNNEQQMYGDNNTQNRPYGQLNTNRSLLKYVLYCIITLGFYQFVFFIGISTDINTIAGRYDRKKTMNYIVMLLLAVVTFGIAMIVWYHNISNRIGDEARRRGISSDFSASTFWLWFMLGSLILVGPFIYLHKLADTSNQIADHYNYYG